MKNKKLLKKRIKRTTALVLASVMLTSPCGAALTSQMRLPEAFAAYVSPLRVRAGAPAVTVDEVAYINLDHYGEKRQVNVVKTCTLNGNKSFTDYGEYTEVINLTNGAAPVSDGTRVTWDLKGYDEETFYFEALNSHYEVDLPWDFDLSYLLNGKPIAADDLAGVEGVVTTIIKATPNKKAFRYFQDNMILMVGTMVDMQGDNYSIQAPGSQLQAMGTKKLVVFTALPGERGDFRIDVGTKDYESLGIFMIMMPATMSSLDRITDYRDVKNKIRSSVNAMSDSSDIIFDALAQMRGSIEETRQAMQKFRESKSIYDAGKDQLKGDADAAIDSLNAIEQSLENLGSRMGTERSDYLKALDELDGIRRNIKSMDEYVKDVEEASYNLEDSLNALKHYMRDSAGEGEEDLKKMGQALGGDPTLKNGDKYNMQMLMGIINNLNHLYEKTADAAGDGEGIAHGAGNLSERASVLINQYDALGGRMNGEYKENMLAFIDELTAFNNNAKISVAATKKALKTGRSLMDAMETSFSAAIDSSLSGMIGMLGGGLSIADGSESFRAAKDIMKSAVDDELDQLEEDSNILNIDTSLALPSLTSDKNPSPASIQIILRTDEITKPDDKEIIDIEPEGDGGSVIGRIKAVIKKLLPF